MVDATVALAFAPLAPVVFFVATRVIPRTCNYELKYRHRVVYRGITNNLSRRLAEHRRDGKHFTHARVTAWSFFRVLARRREIFALAQYRRGHGGENPHYNRRDRG